MKVNNNSTNPSAAATVRGGEVAKAKAHSDKITGDKASTSNPMADLGSTKIDMSKDALAMQKAKAIASKDTPDDAKVARLQKMIDEGKYKVDSEAVADRLVNEHLAMGD